MPRPILRGSQPSLFVQMGAKADTHPKLANAMDVQKRLREKRSSAYMEAMTKLDAGGVHLGREGIDALLAAIREELPEIALPDLPVGIISKCYLGEPYEVHILDRALQIVEHYERGRALPGKLERGRRLAVHPQYAFIEVYENSLRPVTRDGIVSVIEG